MSEILKAKEVAELLRLSESTVLKLLGEGRLPGFKIGASWRIDRDELQEYIEGARVISQPKPRRDSVRKHDQSPIAQETAGVMDQKRIDATPGSGVRKVVRAEETSVQRI